MESPFEEAVGFLKVLRDFLYYTNALKLYI
jgi:hypothetical protein